MNPINDLINPIIFCLVAWRYKYYYYLVNPDKIADLTQKKTVLAKDRLGINSQKFTFFTPFLVVVVVLLLFPKFDQQFDPLSSTLWSCFAILNEFSL